MNRRLALYGGVAVAAGLAGAGAAWWSGRRAPGAAGEGVVGAAADAAADPFWSLVFDTPDGQTLAAASLRGKPLLVNFWATWCPPCIEELPLLDAFYNAHKARIAVLGLAVDQPSAVRKWLQAKPLGFAVGMAGLAGTELSKSLGNTAGSLPFTAVFDAGGAPVHHKTGKVSPEDLAAWVAR
ncbi:MAG: putative thioredoxin family protein [Polaromonas sp.]|nr:putative thioredoxin family protein [Polaromonas sp.]